MIEKEMADAILEAIESKLSPLREKIEIIEKLGSDRVSQADLDNFRKSLETDFQAVGTDIDNTIEALRIFENDTGKKFHVTGKLFQSTMDALQQTTSAKKCEDDIKGIALLKGEEKPIANGGGKA
jgi:hypothetical protein